MNTVQLLQELYMKLAPQIYDKFVYFELDMLILPGAGRMIREVFEINGRFDVAYTYREENDPLSERYGSMNTGIVMLRRTQAMYAWCEVVTEKTKVVVAEHLQRGPVVLGGQNQVAIDRLGAKALKFGTHLIYNQTNTTILSLPVKGFDGTDCCNVANGAAVLHFRGSVKQGILNACCRKLVCGG